MTLNDEVTARQIAYYERTLSRLASEVGGNAKYHADRTAAVLLEIEGIRQEIKTFKTSLAEVNQRVERMAEFMNTLKEKTKVTK